MARNREKDTDLSFQKKITLVFSDRKQIADESWAGFSSERKEDVMATYPGTRLSRENAHVAAAAASIPGRRNRISLSQRSAWCLAFSFTPNNDERGSLVRKGVDEQKERRRVESTLTRRVGVRRGEGTRREDA